MIALLQRVSEASVSVEGSIIARIESGLLVFVGVQKGDQEKQAMRLSERILGYRVFEDSRGRMNLSLSDTGGGLLLVPQFTLAADTERGMRASFTSAAAPDVASELFGLVASSAAKTHAKVMCGQFGADMQVALVNEGPVTFWLEC
ncbi:MAG TPA: D-tyrosyl-tRNA(Tyr) deacylase [Gammaproteobacteria bacterium]|nr:D-tyrosyl-tRNA(Tyr) deacylase [Gammaproteobacteria bacterium]